MWIKLDGENIVGHLHHPRLVHKTGSCSDNGYDLETVEVRLINDAGQYIYKVVDGGLEPMSEEEINNHPNEIAKQEELQEQENQKDRIRQIRNVIENFDNMTAAQKWQVVKKILKYIARNEIGVE